MIKALTYLQWVRYSCDSCLHYKWIERKLTVFILWVDDCLVTGLEDDVITETTKFRELYDATDEDEINEYVGCKFKRTNKYLRITQPVKMQRLIDEFGYDGTKALSTSVVPGSVLARDAIDSPEANGEETKQFPSVIGMLLYVVRHLRHNCINPTRECSGFMSNNKEACVYI